jgi:hypothetical protein
MIVLGVAVIVLVDRAAAQRHVAQQSGIDQFGQGAIDRWAADALLADDFVEVLDQIFGVEMIVTFEDFFDEGPPLLSDALAPTLEILFEPLERRERYLDGTKRKLVGHAKPDAAKQQSIMIIIDSTLLAVPGKPPEN